MSLVHQLGINPPINSFAYTYDKVGNRETKADNNGTANYTYDTLNRLVQATNPIPTNPLETFTYDAVGNRTDSNQNGLSNFNQANQLQDDADFTYSYDNNGNQIQKTNNTTSAFTLYEYDAENKLIRVVREDGSIVNYKYDGLGRRIEKEVDSVVTQYIYDNEDILLELDGINNIVARYTHGLGIDEPLIMEKSGASFFYQADGLGTITELTDSIATVVQSYVYSSFGKIESQLDPNFVQPYTFTAREFDPETGFYYYRARYYEPSIGSFITEDPLEFEAGPNFYRYVLNNPINWVDPFGLILTDEQIANIIFNETRSLSGKRVAEARVNIAQAIINGDEALGDKRPITAPTTAIVPEVERAIIEACRAAVRTAREQRAKGTDPTKGARNFNFRNNDSRAPFYNLPLQTQVGPLDNSFESKQLNKTGIFANTYGVNKR